MLCVGDDIWGRQVINEEDEEEDYCWWPGKVTNIYLRPIEDDSGEIRPEASVKWYSVGITSVVICGQLKLFKENFQVSDWQVLRSCK